MKPIDQREADFKREVWTYAFPQTILQEFFDYWSEPNKSNTKMKFEMEKTWHLGRRLTRWANNGFGGTEKKTVHKPAKMEEKPPQNDFEVLDKFLREYIKRPSEIPFDAFGRWYEFMKENKLLKPFTKSEVQALQEVYANNNEKCRCACVQKTFDGYVNSSLTITDIIKMRGQLHGT